MKNNFRWWIVGLVAVATVINYIDRGALGFLWPEISKDIGLTKTDYAIILNVFTFAYAFGQTLFGKIFDWIGTRLGFVLSIVVWSVATMLHAFATGLTSFAIFRGLLGVSEAGNWPGRRRPMPNGSRLMSARWHKVFSIQVLRLAASSQRRLSVFCLSCSAAGKRPLSPLAR